MIDTRIKTHLPNNSRRLLIVGATLLAAWAIMTFIPLAFKDQTGRLFADPYDFKAYFRGGKWITQGTPPVSEYPQIPTLLFGINRLASTWVDKDRDLQLTAFSAFFSLEMLLVLFLFFSVLLGLLSPSRSNYAFLVLLPPTLWYTYNRFDILPAFLCLIAYSAATKRKWIMVSIILAIATFTKWYPILLLPGFFMYTTILESKFQWKMLMGFAMTSGAILLVTYLCGGLETILSPYQFHLARGMEYIALPVLLDNLIRSLLGTEISLPYFFLFFFIMQIAAPILAVLIKLDSLEMLIDYCIIVTGLFVLFSRIWSPQWFLWLLPFLIISAKNMKTVWLIIAYNLATYLSFPVILLAYGESSYQMQISALLTYLILLIIIIQSARNLGQASNFTKMKAEKAHLTPRAVDGGN